jgi:hypothetical protein
VHNNRLCSTLVNYLRTPSVPFKPLIAPVLTQIMSSPHMFSMSDPPRLEAILLGLKDVCVEWRANADRRGQVFLPKPFQVRIVPRSFSVPLLLGFCGVCDTPCTLHTSFVLSDFPAAVTASVAVVVWLW